MSKKYSYQDVRASIYAKQKASDKSFRMMHNFLLQRGWVHTNRATGQLYLYEKEFVLKDCRGEEYNRVVLVETETAFQLEELVDTGDISSVVRKYQVAAEVVEMAAAVDLVGRKVVALCDLASELSDCSAGTTFEVIAEDGSLLDVISEDNCVLRGMCKKNFALPLV